MTLVPLYNFATILALFAVGEFRDGIFVGMVVAINVAVSTFQELRAYCYQVASAVDLKWMVFAPRVNTDNNEPRVFGAGFGVQFRIGE